MRDPNPTLADSIDSMLAVLTTNRDAGTSPPAVSESADVPAACHGDRAAIRAVLTRLLPRVRNLVRYLVRGDQDADDIAQDALVALLHGLPTYRAEGTIESWADRVTARATFRALAARRRDRARSDVDAMGELIVLSSVPTQPDEYAARRRSVRHLDELPDEQRHALVLHHVLGMSVPEIAVETRAPEETVRSRLRLARARFRELADGEPSAAPRSRR